MVTSKQNQHLSTLVKMGMMVPKLEGDKDLILEVCHHIENLDKEQAKELMQRSVEARGFNAFGLGGVLGLIKDCKWYKDYGHSSFKDLVTNDLGMSTSAAYDYIKIYDCLVDAGVPWEKLEPIGWTKIRHFARYLEKGNVDEWIEVAAKMNAGELHQYAKSLAEEVTKKALVPKHIGYAIEEESTHVDTSAANDDNHSENCEETEKVPLVTDEAALKTLQTKTFKFYPEQLAIVEMAIKMAMKDSGTSYRSVALERICTSFVESYQPDNN